MRLYPAGAGLPAGNAPLLEGAAPARRGNLHPSLPGILAALLVGVLTAQPMLAIGRLAPGDDTVFHLQRLVQFDLLLRQGNLFPRWAPELARGYGFPVFNYYSPLPYYLAELFHLAGLQAGQALLVALIATLSLASLGIYLWVRNLAGEAAALLAAAAYALSPYMLHNLYVRGALPELLGLALLSFVLWALERLNARGRVRYAILASLLYAALALSHNVTAALGSPILVGYVLLLAWTGGAPRWRRFLLLGWPLLLGLGLSAYFWLPALAELNLVQIARLTALPTLDYHNTFQSLQTLFHLPPPLGLPWIRYPILRSVADPTAALALVGLVAGALGAVAAGRSSWHIRGHALYLGLVAVVSLFMIVPWSLPLWTAFPALAEIQFAWRFLGPASLALASLAGLGYAFLFRWAARRPWLTGLALAALVLGLWLYVRPWQALSPLWPEPDATLADILSYDRAATLSVGTTVTGEFLPVAVQELPPAYSDTLDPGRARLDPRCLPAGAQVGGAQYTGERYEVDLESPVPFTAVFNTFYFPGWQAEINGAPVPVTPSSPYGLISFPVPAGRQHLVVRFGSTPVRSLAVGLSLASLLALAVTALLGRRGLWPVQAGWIAGSVKTDAEHTAVRSSAVPALLLALAVLALIAGKSAWGQPRWNGLHSAPFALPLNVDYAHKLLLIGADPVPATPSGGSVEVALYWRAPAKLDSQYSVSLQLVDDRGQMVAQHDNQHPGDYPTNLWPQTGYCRDLHRLVIPPGTPPGTYHLRVSVYPYGQPASTLDVLDSGGTPQGMAADVATLTVTRPSLTWHAQAPAPAVRLERALGDSLAFLGYDTLQPQVKTGETLTCALYWQASRSPAVDLKVQFQFLDEAGAVVYRVDAPPVPGYGTAQWRRGDAWRGVELLPIPPHLAGRYTLAVGLPGEPGIILGQINVVAPPHVLTPPPTAHAQTAAFGNLVTLTGYDLPGEARPGQTVTLQLVWRVESETAEPYKTFVHLLDAEGKMVAGSDAVPGAWQRPSPSWIAGEYITDPHPLQLPADLPAGQYRLEVGLYDSATQKRLPLCDGRNALILSQPLVVR